MGRFPWTPGHWSKDSNSDRIPLDLPSKPKVEGPKHAVNQLLAYIGDADPSRPGTSSQSRARSPSLASLPTKPLPPTVDQNKPLPLEPPAHQLADESSRQDFSAKYLLSKSSRILKRKTSKRAMAPVRPTIRVIQNGLTSPDHSYQPRSSSTIKSFSSSSSTSSLPRSPDNRPIISSPYGFQHLAHTSQDEFHGSRKASKPDPAKEMPDLPPVETAVETAVELVGCADATDTDASVPADDQDIDSASQPMSSPVRAPMNLWLPSTPPKLYSPVHRSDASPRPEASNLPTSRSVENFSRLTRSPIALTGDRSPVSERSMPRLSGRPESASIESLSNWTEETVGTLANVADLRHRSTGLAQILEDATTTQGPPALVHAVSTQDESAIPFSTFPIPDPNLLANSMQELAPDQEQCQSRIGLRHSQSLPSTKLLRRRSQSSGDIPLPSSFAAITPSSPSTIKSSRLSIGLKNIDVEDWEEAIDYAWDHPMDMDEVPALQMSASRSTDPMPCSRPESFLVVRQPSYDSTTQPSTPLMMMQAPDKPLPIPDAFRCLPSLSQPPSARASLRGLGIAPVTRMSQSKSARESFGGPLDDRPSSAALPREPTSPMSKSSSQESIILSIASSIMSTCRSSNSSNSLGDIGELAVIDDETGDASSSRAPSAIIATKPVPPISRDTAEPSDSDGSQETIVSEATGAVQSSPIRPVSADDRKRDFVRPGRSTSISEALIPHRSSSITGRSVNRAHGARPRASTLTSRPRHQTSRASYSLFPTAEPLPARPST